MRKMQQHAHEERPRGLAPRLGNRGEDAERELPHPRRYPAGDRAAGRRPRPARAVRRHDVPRAGGPGGQYQERDRQRRALDAGRGGHRGGGLEERSQLRNKTICLEHLVAWRNEDEARPARRAGRVPRAERAGRLAHRARRASGNAHAQAERRPRAAAASSGGAAAPAGSCSRGPPRRLRASGPVDRVGAGPTGCVAVPAVSRRPPSSATAAGRLAALVTVGGSMSDEYVRWRKTRSRDLTGLGWLEADAIVWDKGDVKVRDVYEELRLRRRIAYTTVMSVLRNLHVKGLLEQDKEPPATSSTAPSCPTSTSPRVSSTTWSRRSSAGSRPTSTHTTSDVGGQSRDTEGVHAVQRDRPGPAPARPGGCRRPRRRHQLGMAEAGELPDLSGPALGLRRRRPAAAWLDLAAASAAGGDADRRRHRRANGAARVVRAFETHRVQCRRPGLYLDAAYGVLLLMIKEIGTPAPIASMPWPAACGRCRCARGRPRQPARAVAASCRPQALNDVPGVFELGR